MSNVISLRATGNADSDTSKIQSAISQLTHDRDDNNPGTIILEPGQFRINEPLVFGDFEASPAIQPPRMAGAGLVVLRWCGLETTDPMIKYRQPWYGCGAYLQNLHLRCDNPDTGDRCRGIRVQKATYGHELRDIWVYLARQVGIDLVDCWGSAARNILVTWTKGIHMRLSQFNNCVLDTIKLTRGSGTDFPPVDDTTTPWHLRDYEYVQTSAAERGGLVFNTGSCLVANNVMPEGNDYVTTPEITLNGYVNAQFNILRFEGSDCTEELIKTVGDCRGIHINNTYYLGSYGGPAKALVRATSEDRGIRVDAGRIAVTDGVIICDGGSHTGHEVQRVDERVISMDKWIVEENSPTMSGKIYADSNKSVAIP